MEKDRCEQRMFENLSGYSRIFGSLLGYDVKDIDNGLILSGPLNMPTFNLGMRDDKGANALKEVVNESERHFCPRNVQYTVWTFKHDGNETTMDKLGYGRLTTVPGMVREGAAEERSVKGLSIELVQNRKMLKEFAQVGFEVFEFLDSDRALYMKGINDAPDRVMNDADIFIGYLQGDPVATGISFTKGRSVGVYFVGTVENARNRGIGTAMTARCINSGIDRGADVSLLQSSEEGFKVYERLGFKRCCDIEIYSKKAQN